MKIKKHQFYKFFFVGAVSIFLLFSIFFTDVLSTSEDLQSAHGQEGSITGETDKAPLAKKIVVTLHDRDEKAEAPVAESTGGSKAPSTSAELHPIINELAPRSAALFEEVVKNPHSVPPSFIDFSVIVAKRMEGARDSLSLASKLFLEFEDCAFKDQREKTVALRAYCLLNARRLTTWHPRLAERWESLTGRVDSEVAELLSISQSS